MRKEFLTLLFLITIQIINGQGWEEEIGFVYTKGEYLIQTERYDNAITQLTQVINQNPEYENALLLRAKAKYALGAFKGAKQDILWAIDLKGLEGNAIKLLGMAEYELGNKDEALKNLVVAESILPENHEIKEVLGEMYLGMGKDEHACEKWEEAQVLGSRKSRDLLVKYCNQGYIASNNRPSEVLSETNSRTKTYPKTREESRSDGGDFFLDREQPEEPKKKKLDYTDNRFDPGNVNEDPVSSSENTIEENLLEPPVFEDEEDSFEVDANVNVIEIDEDLSLNIYGNGLGTRRIMDQPSILILSDATGEVAIEVCVNRSGRITEAQFDPSRSTINKQSLVSLALRKSKEFWFARSNDDNQCGIILFDIKGN